VDVNGILDEPEGWDDPLSGLEGPDFWQRVLVAETGRAIRYQRSLTVVICELEGVLEMIDSGDPESARRAVRAAAQSLRRACRPSDYCTRIGPTRFGIILTETDEIAAINFVERVRESGLQALPAGSEILRYAFGWASPRGGESPGRTVRRAYSRLKAELIR
jgi:diguanylate cyclase (GGDEF)-like protein